MMVIYVKYLEFCSNIVVHLWGYFVTQGYNDAYWHSANDKESEGYVFMIIILFSSFWNGHFNAGVWRQADGTLLSWSPKWVAWMNGQGDPNGGKASNCFFVYLDESTYAGQWGDTTCNSAFHYVCERGF